MSHVLFRIIFIVAITTSGTFTIDAQKVCPASNEILRVAERSGRVGFLTPDGKVLLRPEQFPPGTVLVHDFSEGLAPVAINPDHPDNTAAGFSPGRTPFGFIDTSGKMVIEPQFDYTYGFCDGLAFVDKGDMQGYIDKTGKIVIDLRKDCGGPVTAGIKLGRCPRPRLDEGILGEESEGLIALTNGSRGSATKYGFADRTGRLIIPAQFEPEMDHHLSIRSMGKFVEGRAKVKLNGLYGYIDHAGRIVINPRFTVANDFSEGLAFVVEKGGTAGYIDRSGRWKIRSARWVNGGLFSGGLAPIAVRSSTPRPGGDMTVWGFIDKKGRQVVPPRFDGADPFRGNVARIYEHDGRTDTWASRFGYIDRRGRYIWKPGSTLPQPTATGSAPSDYSSQSPCSLCFTR